MCSMPPTALHLAVSSYEPDVRQPSHAHDELQISLVLSGAVRERVGSCVECAGALSVVVKDPQVMHADDFGPIGALTVRLSLPSTGLTDLVERADRARAWSWTHDATVAAPFLRIASRGTHGERVFPTDDDDVVDLLAAVSARAAPDAAGEAPLWLRDALRQIDDGWQPSLGVRDIARAAGVHPVYLARCVRRWFGVSASELLRQARVRHAAQAVAAKGTTLSAVAHAHGYADEPHFCRELRRTAGVTPGRLRRLVTGCERLRA